MKTPQLLIVLIFFSCILRCSGQVEYDGSGSATISGETTEFPVGSTPPLPPNSSQSQTVPLSFGGDYSSQTISLDLGQAGPEGGAPAYEYNATTSLGGSYNSASFLFNAGYSDGFYTAPEPVDSGSSGFLSELQASLNFTLLSPELVTITGDQTGGLGSYAYVSLSQDNGDELYLSPRAGGSGVVPRNFSVAYQMTLPAGTYGFSFNAGDMVPGGAGDAATVQLVVGSSAEAPEPSSLVLFILAIAAFAFKSYLPKLFV